MQIPKIRAKVLKAEALKNFYDHSNVNFNKSNLTIRVFILLNSGNSV